MWLESFLSVFYILKVINIMQVVKNSEGGYLYVMTFSEFREWCIKKVAIYGSQRGAARKYNVGSGLFTQVIRYRQESPTLRRAMNCPLNPPRRRLTVDTDDATVTRFDAQRGDKSRVAHLVDLMDGFDGAGELP